MFRDRLRLARPATLIAAIALLCLAAGGTATAAKLISGKDVRNSSLTGADVRNGSLGSKDLSSAAKRSLRGAAGAAGVAGPAGPAGPAGAKGDAGPQGDTRPQGVQGERGPRDAFAAGVESHEVTGSGSRLVLEKTLPAGRYAITAKATLRSTDDEEIQCRLRKGPATDLDSVTVQPLVARETVVTLVAPADYATQSTLRVLCFESLDDTVTLEDVKVNAIQVAAIG